MVSPEKDSDTFFDRHPTRKEILIGLALVAGVFFLWSLSVLGHDDSDKHLVPHVFSVLLELFLGVIVIEIVWRSRERREEEKQRATQLRHIKSYMFMASMQRLFAVNFENLKNADGIKLKNFEEIKAAGSKSDFRKQFDELKRKITKEERLESGKNRVVVNEQAISYEKDAVGKIFMEYVNAEEKVWKEFLVLATRFNIPTIVKDMTEILSCIAQARKASGDEKVTIEQFLSNADKLQGRPLLQSKIEKIVKAGILKFIEFAEDVRASDKDTFDALMESYEAGRSLTKSTFG